MQKISVIIPSHNRVTLLTRCLDSVFNQTREADEIILVDDGSDDGTCNFIRSQYPSVKVIQQTQQGVSVARNRAIQQATGNWIAFLDSDDEWLPDKLHQQEKVIERAKDCALIHTDEIWVRNGIRVNPMKKHRKYGGHIFTHCLPLCCISPSSVLMRRDILLQAGMFDENLPACEDYDLWLRICHRWPVYFIPKKLVIKYGGHEDQLSKKYWGMDRFRIQSLVKLLTDEELTDEHRQLVIITLNQKLEIFIKGARKHGNTEYVEQYSHLLYKYSLKDNYPSIVSN